MAAVRGSRTEKVRRIFERFDANADGGLDRAEMAALVVAVNPRVKFSDEQIAAILDEVFRTYADFIGPSAGLTFDGLLRTYDDGAGDVDRDFDALDLRLDPDPDAPPPSAAAASGGGGGVEGESSADPRKRQSAPAWATSPHHGLTFDSSWSLLEDLEVLIKRLRLKQVKLAAAASGNAAAHLDSFSDFGWSREIESSNGERRSIHWDESSRDYSAFVKELSGLRARADAARGREEAFDGHMALGRGLYEHNLFQESLKSFQRACELQPTDVRPHFRAGNALYALGRHLEAKEEFLLALEAAEASGTQWSYLLPQIHVNLGIALEAEGMVLGSCEHYREAAILAPNHFRALKLLGSALFGVGEYRAAEKALEEAIFLKPEYADAHCDLGSALHAMGEDERAIQEYQKAIDLKPGHVDALYNLGGLFMDVGRFPRATEMYTRVLAVRPNHWRAQLNKAVALLGAEEPEEANKALKESLKMTKRVEVYDAITHLKILQKKKKSLKGKEGDVSFFVVEVSKFKRVGDRTTLRLDLAIALEIRAFQKLTRLNQCDVDNLKKELNETDVPVSYSGCRIPEKSIRKAALEIILRKLLRSLKPETFQGAVKAINQRILSVLDMSGSGRVDLGMFFAIIAPICMGSPQKRKKAAFDALLWRPNNEGKTEIRKSDAVSYIKLLRVVYLPSHGASEIAQLQGNPDLSLISHTQFVVMFDDPDCGFGILATLLKLESGDRTRHGQHTCSICQYPIIGSRFKETKQRFSLCNCCYSEGKVPSAFKQEEYQFKEYANQSEALKDKCVCFTMNPRHSENNL